MVFFGGGGGYKCRDEYLGGDVLGQHGPPLAAAEEGDLLLGGGLDEGGHHLPQAVEQHGGVDEPQLRQALREVGLQHLEDGLQGLGVHVAQPDACNIVTPSSTSGQREGVECACVG